MTKMILLLFAGSILGCSHADSDFEEKISFQQCDEALKVHSDPLIKAEKSVIYAASNIAAYTYITANYTAEVLWDVTAGAIAIVALCAPTLAISMAVANSHGGYAVPVCFGPPDALGHVMAPPLGKRARKKTENMRCPDLAGMSRVIGRVVSCYENKGDTESLKKAAISLENIEMSADFFTCLPLSEQMAIRARRLDLKTR